MMKFRTLLLPLLVLSVVASCKKEEVDKTYMDGTLRVSHNIPRYVSAGETYTMSATGITAPDGTGVGYSFRNPISKRTDTTSVYSYTVPDSLGTFSILVTAFPEKSVDLYYSSTSSVVFTVVSDARVGGSLENLPVSLDSKTADLYSRTYVTLDRGGCEWICSNLSRIDRDVSGNEVYGRSYLDCPAMQNIVGAYYTWEEAQTACPEGWRLPSDEDWVALMKTCGAPESLEPLQDSSSGAGALMVKATVNGDAMLEYFRGVTITGQSNINVLPAGYATVSDGAYSFTGFGSYAAFWTSSELGDSGVYRYIYQENDNVYVGLADKKAFAASVRCVR